MEYVTESQGRKLCVNLLGEEKMLNCLFFFFFSWINGCHYNRQFLLTFTGRWWLLVFVHVCAHGGQRSHVSFVYFESRVSPTGWTVRRRERRVSALTTSVRCSYAVMPSFDVGASSCLVLSWDLPRGHPCLPTTPASHAHP